MNIRITFTIICSLRRRTYAGMLTPVRSHSSPTVFSTGKSKTAFFFCQQMNSNIAHTEQQRSVISDVISFVTSAVQ